MARRGGAKLSAARRAANRKALERSLGGLRQLRAQGALTPREGQGDYRVAEQATNAVRNGRTNPDAVWHNPAPVRGAGSGHAGGRVHKRVFLPIKNGLPEFAPYVYGAARPARATRGLDYAAIAAADAQIDGRARARVSAQTARYRRKGYAVPQQIEPPAGSGLRFRVRETA